MLGRTHSEETKHKMRDSAIRRGDCGGAEKLRGTKRPKDVVEKLKKTMFKKGHKTWNKGKHLDAIRGDKHWAWKGGVTPEHRAIRVSLEYKLWRRSVFERDNYSCVACGARSAKGVKVLIHADHIRPFALFPELRFAIDNGRTLCAPCHRITPTYGFKTRI